MHNSYLSVKMTEAFPDYGIGTGIDLGCSVINTQIQTKQIGGFYYVSKNQQKLCSRLLG